MKTQNMFGAAVSALAAAVIASLTAGAASANLITNGNFSANASSYVTYPGYSPGGGASGSNPATPSGWNIAGTPSPVVGVNGPDTSVGTPFAPASTAGVRDFAFMQDTSIYSSVSISQTISTVAGQLYALSYVAAQRSNDPNATLEALVLDAANSNAQIASQAPSITTSAFLPFGLTFTAKSTSTTIEFLNNTNNGADNTVDVSNVAVDAVPLPASMGLLGLGAAGLGMVLLKRRAHGSTSV